MKRLAFTSLAFVAVSAIASAAAAHHSFAMFDNTKELAISGTVKAWQFTAPHSWLQIISKDKDGKDVQWSFEGGGPGGGPLKADTFKVGDKVSVKTHPMKDGRMAGSLGDVTFADGHQVIMRLF